MNAPQVPDHRPSSEQNQPEVPAYTQLAPPAFAASPVAPKPAARKMPAFLKVSIILLIGLTVASISLLFIGDFQGRFERVFSTFALFATFVVLTAIDTSRERKNDWYAPVALIANTYILGLLLIVIWMTPFNSFSLLFDIVWKSIFVIVVIRLVIICCELLLRSGSKGGGVTARFAFITSILAMLSGILFTAPTGVAAFNLEIPDLYWKISTALLILTALGVSVTLLLRWSASSEDREERRNAARAAANAAPLPYVAGQPYNSGQSFAPTRPVGSAPDSSFAQPNGAAQVIAPVQLDNPVQQLPATGYPVASAPQVAPGAVTESAPAEEQLLPWPTFADGQPFPAGPDGQPDFAAAGVQPPRV